MPTRRRFLAYCGGTTLGVFGYDRFGIRQALAQLPGGTLDPATVPKYQSPLLIPPAMPRAGSVKTSGGRNADYYEISMKQVSQQVLPAGLPRTACWAYGPVASLARTATRLHIAPALTIEARAGEPVIVKWINDLKDAAGKYLPHLLAVDPTLHWANPGGGTVGRDTRPTFASTPLPYTGPVPMVTHVHGAVGVGDESDGYAEAWYLPAATDIPAGYATQGTWYGFFAAKAQAQLGQAWGPGFALCRYPNSQRAGTLWFHDHTLGMTRLNVYAGPAGFYLVRGGPAGDKAVLDARSGLAAVLPGPAPMEGDKFPPNKAYFEIPLAIQDRSFNADGSLFYPDTRAFFDGVSGPYVPASDLPPYWNPEFFGNTLIVNGQTWPYLNVEQRRYRLRLLNGCLSRFLILDFSAIPGVGVWQLGHEGGFLPAPVNVTAFHGNQLLLAPAERADVIVDFSAVPAGAWVLGNAGPDEPFGGGEPGTDFQKADAATTGQVMQFRVGPATAADPTTPPQFLLMPPLPALPASTTVRRLALLEQMSAYAEDAPVMALLGTVQGAPTQQASGTWQERGWMDAVTENPAVGAVETWEIYNTTADAHPMHVHEVAFQVLDRQDIVVDEAAHKVQLGASAAQPPNPWELGYKDTVVAYPGQVTRLRARFGNAGQFVWHCHIVEHEDNEMMRPLRVGPPQAGQPGQ